PFVFNNYKNTLLLRKVSSITLLILVGLYLIAVLFSDIIVLFVGNDYRSIVEILPYLFVIPIFQTLMDVLSVGLLVKEKSKLNLIFSILMFFNLLISMFIIRNNLSLTNISIVLAGNY